MRLRVAHTETGHTRHATAGRPAGAKYGRGGWVMTLCGHPAQVPQAQGRPVNCSNCKRELRNIKHQAAYLLSEEEE